MKSAETLLPDIFLFQAEDGIRGRNVTGVQTCALPISSVGREMLARARIGFGLGIVENGYDETALVEAFSAQDLEAGERRLLKSAREWMARLPFRSEERRVGKDGRLRCVLCVFTTRVLG